MNHRHIQNQMADYLEGDLPLAARALFDAHLDECEDCALEVAEMRATVELLHSLPDPEPPPMLVADVMRRIRAEQDRSGLIDSIRRGFSWLLSPPVLYPVSVTALALGLLLATGQVRWAVPANGPERRLAAATPTPAEARPTSRLASSAGNANPHSGLRLIVRPGGQPASPLGAGSADRSLESTLLTDLMAAHGPYVQRPPLAPSLPRSEFPGVGSAAEPTFETVGLARSYTSPASGSSGVAHPLPTPEQWLVLVERSPIAFADKLSSLSLAERELWVDRLARRAAERGRLDQVVAALSSSGSERAARLAEDFRAVASRSSTGSDSNANAD